MIVPPPPPPLAASADPHVPTAVPPAPPSARIVPAPDKFP